ncbi:MAG TPA: hypothetical protein PLX66_00285 [Bacilli bacterium]|nr:hypothetical protein [Bacilli bacterium]
MTEIKRINDISELVVPNGVIAREILIKNEAKSLLAADQVEQVNNEPAPSPYSPVLDSTTDQPVTEAVRETPEPVSSVETPVVEAPVNFSNEPAINPLGAASEPVKAEAEPVVSEPAPIMDSKPEESVTAPEMPVVNEEPKINDIDALKRVQEALDVSMKIVNEAINQYEKDAPYKKVA